MTALAVHHRDTLVAIINRQHRCADGYRPETPWLLLYRAGRVERCATLREARAEAEKTWGQVKFTKT